MITSSEKPVANLVSVGNRKMSHVFKHKICKCKHENYKISDQLPEQLNCEKTGVVYQFRSNLCASSYVGKTWLPFINVTKNVVVVFPKEVLLAHFLITLKFVLEIISKT